MIEFTNDIHYLTDEDDVNVWDEGPDSDKNLRYDSKKPGVVSGATFNKLVERMTSEKDHGMCVCGGGGG